MKDYVRLNKEVYDFLAKEYDERDHEIKSDFWFEIFDCAGMDEDKRVLEIGPGNGRNIKIMREFNNDLEIEAIEISEELCKIIRKNIPGIDLKCEDILEYELEKNRYDVVEAIALIHLFEIEDAKIVLKKIYDCLKDDGCLIIGTTVNDEDSEGFYEKKDYSNNIKRFRHKYTEESFERLLNECGFKIYKKFPVYESDRNKLWNDLIAVKM